MKEASGHEALCGCITFPVLLSENKVGEIYGRRFTRAPKNQSHWYLSGPHVGVWNAEAFQASKEIILCESVIDALTFWIAGFRNVTYAYGNQGFTEELFQAFIKSGIEVCWIAWDNDEKSNPLALQLAERLMAQGIKCMRIIYPGKIKDANEFAMKVKDGNGTAHGSLSMLMRNAEWLMPQDIDVTKRFVPKSVEPLSSTALSTAPQSPMQPAPKEETQPATCASLPVTIPTPAIVDEPKKLLLLGAKTVEVATPTEPNQTTVPVKVPVASLEVEIKDNEIIIPIGNRSYRIRGLARNTNGFDSMKVNVLARKGEAFFVDTLDIYAARGRNAFIKEASRELALEEEVIKRDLGKVLLKLEELQDSFALQNVEAKKIEISEPDKKKALELLKSPDLLDRILNDFDACGVVGERTNKLVGYLAATSRKLDRPLAIMVQSSSAAGKSSLMEAILRFMPGEEQISYSAMTGQSLFYMGGMDLKGDQKGTHHFFRLVVVFRFPICFNFGKRFRSCLFFPGGYGHGQTRARGSVRSQRSGCPTHLCQGSTLLLSFWRRSLCCLLGKWEKPRSPKNLDRRSAQTARGELRDRPAIIRDFIEPFPPDPQVATRCRWDLG